MLTKRGNMLLFIIKNRADILKDFAVIYGKPVIVSKDEIIDINYKYLDNNELQFSSSYDIDINNIYINDILDGSLISLKQLSNNNYKVNDIPDTEENIDVIKRLKTNIQQLKIIKLYYNEPESRPINN